MYRTWVFSEDYPFPLVISMFSSIVILFPGAFWMVSRRECICLKKDDEDDDSQPPEQSLSTDEPLKVERTVKDRKITCWGWTKRFFHWALFCAVFLFLFVFAQVYANPLCQSNGNICTLFFRSDLFLLVLILLAIIKASRRGKRLDWLVAVLIGIGISLFSWNTSQKFVLNFSDDLRLLTTCLLGALSFALFVVSVRRATVYSGIFKTMVISSFYMFLLSLVGTILLEGSGPWSAFESIGFYIIWKILVLSLMLPVIFWAMVATTTYSETIVPALALQISLFAGDFGIHNYIVAGFQWNALFAVGVPLLCIGFLWLIKRTVTLHCPDTISCLRGRMGCAEKDLWDDDLSDDQQRDDNEQVALISGHSVEDAYSPGKSRPKITISHPQTSLSASPQRPASVLSGGMGNYVPDAVSAPMSYQNSPNTSTLGTKKNYGSISGNLMGNYDPGESGKPRSMSMGPSAEPGQYRQPERTNPSNSVYKSSSVDANRASPSSLSGNSLGNYVPPVSYHNTDFSASNNRNPPPLARKEKNTPSGVDFSGNTMGNYSPDEFVGLEYEDNASSAAESSAEEHAGRSKKKKRAFSGLFKKKK